MSARGQRAIGQLGHLRENVSRRIELPKLDQREAVLVIDVDAGQEIRAQLERLLIRVHGLTMAAKPSQ